MVMVSHLDAATEKDDFGTDSEGINASVYMAHGYIMVKDRCNGELIQTDGYDMKSRWSVHVGGVLGL